MRIHQPGGRKYRHPGILAGARNKPALLAARVDATRDAGQNTASADLAVPNRSHCPTDKRKAPERLLLANQPPMPRGHGCEGSSAS